MNLKVGVTVLILLTFFSVSCGEDGAVGLGLLGDESAADLGTDGKVFPTFLNISSRLTSSSNDEKQTLSEIQFDISNCAETEPRVEKIVPVEGKVTVLNFLSTDHECEFKILSVTVSSRNSFEVFAPEEVVAVNSSRTSLVGALRSSSSSQQLTVDLSSTYTGHFKETESIIMLFGFDAQKKGLGLESRRVDWMRPRDSETSVILPDNNGVGMRIDAFVAKRPPGGPEVIALELRFSCLELREMNRCFGEDMTDFQFRMIEHDGVPPEPDDLTEVFSETSKVTLIKPENLFGNGVYAVVATPIKIPLSALDHQLFWVVVSSGNRISAFEVSLKGVKVF